jgi:hypothetical protein
MFLSNVVVSLYFKCFIVLRNGFSEIRVPLASLLVRCFFVLVPLGKSSYFYGNIYVACVVFEAVRRGQSWTNTSSPPPPLRPRPLRRMRRQRTRPLGLVSP